MLNAWVNFGGGAQVAQYRKVGDNVQVRGLIKSGATGTVAFTLPAGFRPPAQATFTCSADGGFSTVGVEADGDVVPSFVAPSTNAFVAIFLMFSTV